MSVLELWGALSPSQTTEAGHGFLTCQAFAFRVFQLSLALTQSDDNSIFLYLIVMHISDTIVAQHFNARSNQTG
eukprot:4789026-Amphidinium_carterae.1